MSASDTVLPLSRWEILHTSDPAQACAHLSSLFRPHKVITRPLDKRINFKHNRVELGQFSMNFVSYGKEVTINARDNSDNYLIKFTLRGATQVRQLHTSFATCPSTVCVLNPTLPLEDHMSPDCDMLIVQLAGDHVRQMLSDELGTTLKKPLEFLPLSVPIVGTIASYAHMVMAVCDDINRSRTGLQPQFVSKQIEHMLISLLLMELPHTYSDILRKDPVQAEPEMLRHIENYIHSHLSEPISVKDLAVVAGTSVRTLQKTFYHYKGISPMSYLRNCRLEYARKLLLNGDGKPCSVTTVASKSGFTHLSRFAQHYRRRFGELPSATGKGHYFIH